jgi:hypothetical protein
MTSSWVPRQPGHWLAGPPALHARARGRPLRLATQCCPVGCQLSRRRVRGRAREPTGQRQVATAGRAARGRLARGADFFPFYARFSHDSSGSGPVQHHRV